MVLTAAIFDVTFACSEISKTDLENALLVQHQEGASVGGAA